MTALERDLRYSTAPLHERCVYAQLFAARHSIADALSLGRDPIVVVARAIGVERDEATLELDRLRAAGLVGDGLTLLAGGRARRRSSSETAPVANEHVEDFIARYFARAGERLADRLTQQRARGLRTFVKATWASYRGAEGRL